MHFADIKIKQGSKNCFCPLQHTAMYRKTTLSVYQLNRGKTLIKTFRYEQTDTGVSIWQQHLSVNIICPLGYITGMHIKYFLNKCSQLPLNVHRVVNVFVFHSGFYLNCSLIMFPDTCGSVISCSVDSVTITGRIDKRLPFDIVVKVSRKCCKHFSSTC